MSKSLFVIILSSVIIFSLQTEHCLETSDNACIACEDGYYLSNNECKDGYLKPVFHDCKETKDGVTCEACHIGYFFSKNHECVNTQFCQKSKDSLLAKNVKKTTIYQQMVCSVLLLQIVLMEIEKQEYV